MPAQKPLKPMTRWKKRHKYKVFKNGDWCPATGKWMPRFKMQRNRRPTPLQRTATCVLLLTALLYSLMLVAAMSH